MWAAAGPSEFDCSGLVVWAFAQQGIALPHYTGDLWNLGTHVSQADLQPGDLVFFFGEDHVGIYIGDGLMVDAPAPGQDVMVQPISEDPSGRPGSSEIGWTMTSWPGAGASTIRPSPM